MNTFQEWHSKQDPEDILSLISVPKKTYDRIQTYQVILYDRNSWNFYDGEEPVALKGAIECRIRKYKSQSGYLSNLWMRYIQMKKITCVTVQEWVDFAYKIPTPRRHFAHNSIEAARPLGLVNKYGFVLIKGKRFEVSPERLSILKDIYSHVGKEKLP